MLSANDMEKQVVIGTIIAPHGVRGDIRILPQTDHPEQFLELSSLLLEDGRSLQGCGNNERCRTAARQKGFNQQ